MNIIKTKIPGASVLNNSSKKFDYKDSFTAVFNDDRNLISTTDIGKAFFTSGPKWVEKLFSLRNKIVSIFGLKTSGNSVNREKQLELFKCNTGD